MRLVGMLLVAFCTGLASVSCQGGPEIISFVDVTPIGISTTGNRTLHCIVRGGVVAFHRFPGGNPVPSFGGLIYYRETRNVRIDVDLYILTFPEQDPNYAADYQCRARSISGETNSTHVITIRVDVDECLPMPCKNGASCTDGFMSYQCACLVGFTGGNCETTLPPQILVGSSCENGTRTLRCFVHTTGGLPSLTVIFYRLQTGLPARDGPLPYDSTFSTSSTGEGIRILSFPMLDPAYEGMYQCRASTIFGTSTADITVEAGPDCHPSSRKTVIIAASTSVGAFLLLLVLATAICIRRRRRPSSPPNIMSPIEFKTYELPAEFGGGEEQIGKAGGTDNTGPVPEDQVEGSGAADETTVDANKGKEGNMVAAHDVDFH